MEDQERALPNVKPGHFNVNQYLVAKNKVDENDNPTGGDVILYIPPATPEDEPAILIRWQDGPRGQEGTDELAEPNGAFVEDVIYAAIQRLEFFQDSKFKCEENAQAIKHLELAIESLYQRSNRRGAQGTLGKHEV